MSGVITNDGTFPRCNCCGELADVLTMTPREGVWYYAPDHPCNGLPLSIDLCVDCEPLSDEQVQAKINEVVAEGQASSAS